MFGRRDQRAAAEWQRFFAHASSNGLSIVTVVDVYQLAREGTKATIAMSDEYRLRDAWFWWDRVDPGATLAVTFSTGYGLHTHHDGVVYVGSQLGGSGVHDRLDATTAVRAQRHHRRATAKRDRLHRKATRTRVSSAISR